MSMPHKITLSTYSKLFSVLVLLIHFIFKETHQLMERKLACVVFQAVMPFHNMVFKYYVIK